ncbi:suppressor of fused domain protein [Kurthia senegalensis]|uniref:suppressor of fused domain protein n=1 Tax=Kurthia senegalensis TaxID=1033740 RepID=UPI0002882FEC|nr:suppressor of fused domain protein [Kurthia senegalensis]
MQENKTEENLTVKVNKAIRNGDLATLQQLYNQNEEIFHAYTPVGTVLHLAAEYNQSAIVKWLIEMGMDIDIEDKNYGHTPIRNAISEGHVDLFKEMFQLGAKIYFENPKHPHQDPLFGAILAGSKEMAQLLIDHGADTTILYFERKDAELMAKEQNQTEILALIQAHNATLPDDHVPRTTPKEVYDEEEDYEDEEEDYEEEEEYEEPSSHAVIRAAFEEMYGPIQTTYYQNFPSEVPIQAHIIAPSTKHPYYVLFTTGMSDRAVGYNLLYVENMMKVPAGWLDGDVDWTDREKIWPINWLVKLACIPHDESVQPNRGVIVPNKGELVHPYGIETHLSCMLISTPTDSDIQRLSIEGEDIRIDELVPIYKAEWQYAEANGYAALQEKLTAAQVQEVIDFQRPSVVDMSASEVPSKPIKKLKKLSNSETIRQTFEKEYGPIALQFTGLLEESDPAIQISGNIIYPTKKHPYYVVCTLGVSNDLSIKEPHTHVIRVNEMMMKLPLNWVASEEEWTLPEKNWPLRLMAEYGYHVRKNELKVKSYTTFPVEGQVAAILSEYTEMDHLLARKPREKDVSGEVNEMFFISINQLIPIYESEMNYAEGIYGVDLIHCLEKQQADNVLVVNRPPSI